MGAGAALALAAGAILSVAGLLIVLGRAGTRAAALSIVTLIALSLAFLSVPRVAAKAAVGAVWTNPCKYLALAGGALLIAGLYASRRGAAPAAGAAPPRGLIRDYWLARALLGIFLALCGIQHFAYAEFVATLVPDWIPGHLFWTCFAGVALIAGGIGVVIPRTTRLAALLLGAMIFTWFLVLHIPRAVAGGGNLDEFSGVCESLAMSGVAFLIAGYPAERET